jgi:hypothetical protein
LDEHSTALLTQTKNLKKKYNTRREKKGGENIYINKRIYRQAIKKESDNEKTKQDDKIFEKSRKENDCLL